MAEETTQPSSLWYVRRGKAVKGPFPARQVAKYVLLGRIRPGDEVSRDQEKWRAVRDIPALMPEAVRAGASDEELRMLRQREDERSGEDRRGDGEAPADEDQRRPGKPDRRQEEPEAMVRHRRQKAELLNALREGSEKERRSRRFIMPAILLATVVVIVAGVVIGPTSLDDAPDCSAPPGPGVNWNNCTLELVDAGKTDLTGARIRNARLREANLIGAQLQGADLAYTDLSKADLSYAEAQGADFKGATLQAADLTYANLAGADLSYADLKNARLGGAVITGTHLSGAVWHDGRTCARESVGECRRAAPETGK